MKKEGYIPRLIDGELERYLTLFGAVNITGPKWCGKTWAAYNCCNSATLIADPKGNYQNRRLAMMDPTLIFKSDLPQLIDEWQDVPGIWDAVRYRVDDAGMKGMYVLTGSATPNRDGFVHSGTGRIKELRMSTMTLLERGISDGKVSLRGLFDRPEFSFPTQDMGLMDVIDYTIHGGWPGVMNMSTDASLEVARGYIETLLNNDISFDGVGRNPAKMSRLIRSLARNESTIASKKALKRDMLENPDDPLISDSTLDEYLSVLERLHFIDFQPAFDPNMRSSVRVGKTPKRHLADPSLTAAAMGMGVDSYINDLNSFGFLFEALCVHDLKVYTMILGGKVMHYRDGDGNEIDAVVELSDGRWGAFEIKIGAHEIDNGARSLLKIDRKIRNQEHGRPPEFMCVICGMTNAAYVRDDGIYVLPPTSLRP
ncbi:MAG: DUF4143 domain-containing protein [Candidatus Methanomethylophilaceae archaeon]|nr:DUF4143 domain-containing protein [Candidatus Methanomethylophilaceae archaeon]